MAAIRHQPLASLTWDLGLWERPNETSSAVLTERGVRFLGEALA
jgi:hypothetical protein